MTEEQADRMVVALRKHPDCVSAIKVYVPRKVGREPANYVVVFEGLVDAKNGLINRVCWVEFNTSAELFMRGQL